MEELLKFELHEYLTTEKATITEAGLRRGEDEML
jgi:hypothetical protein